MHRNPGGAGSHSRHVWEVTSPPLSSILSLELVASDGISRSGFVFTEQEAAELQGLRELCCSHQGRLLSTLPIAPPKSATLRARPVLLRSVIDLNEDLF